MILRKLSDFIIIDDIRRDANASELYFLSHLMDHEMLTLPDNWPARIYTSKFIFDMMRHKKPDVEMKFFRILQPNAPVKFKSKDKTIMVTMFETEEITHNVMFYFEDQSTTHLYTGIFSDISHLNFNSHFRKILEKGIDYIYVDTTRCGSMRFIFTDDTVDEILQICTSNPNQSIAVIMPDFGYEEILVSLLKKLPQEVYLTYNQRVLLARLGFSELIGRDPESRIKINSPGITPESIQSKNLFTIYLTDGEPSSSACEIKTLQWSPLPSVMNLQEILELTRPKNIVPIKKVPFEGKVSLPASFKFFLSSNAGGNVSHAKSASAGDSSIESLIDGDSNKSSYSVFNITGDSTSEPRPKSINQSEPAKEEHIQNKLRTSTDSQQKNTLPTGTKTKKKDCDQTKKRVGLFRKPHECGFEFDDSD